MKKITFVLVLLLSFLSNAQLLLTDDFNSLTIGNVGTDFTGVTPGQGGWLTTSNNGTGAPSASPPIATTSTNAGNSNYQIIANGNASTNGLQIISVDGNSGSRYMTKTGLATLWSTRTTGNNVFQFEFDFFTGPATTSKCQTGIRLYGLDNSTTPATFRTLSGFALNMDTKVLSGIQYLNNAGSFGTYLINLATGGLVLTADTWYRVGFSYDTLTGEARWKTSPSGASKTLASSYWVGPFNPSEVDMLFLTPTPTASVFNTVTSTIVYDNFTTKAVASEALLGTEKIEFLTTQFLILPNPAKDFVKITSSDFALINAIELSDVNGRIIKSEKINSISEIQVSISELSNGIYFMKILSDKGTAIKKIVKE